MKPICHVVSPEVAGRRSLAATCAAAIVAAGAVLVNVPANAAARPTRAEQARAAEAHVVKGAQNSIEHVRVSRNGSSVFVWFGLRAPLTSMPDSVSVASPASVSFDFDNTVNTSAVSERNIAAGDVTSLTLVHNKGGTRAVFRLRAPTQYVAKIEHGMLLVHFAPIARQARSESPAGPAAGAGNKPEAEVGRAATSFAPAGSLATGSVPEAAAVAKGWRSEGGEAESKPAVSAQGPTARTEPINAGPVVKASGAAEGLSGTASKPVVQGAQPLTLARPAGEVKGTVRAVQRPEPGASEAAAKVPEMARPTPSPDTREVKVALALARTAGPSAPAAMHSVRAIDFRRGEHNAGRIIIDLSDAAVQPEIRRTGNTLTAVFEKTTAAATLTKKLDVLDFGTPVRTVSTSATDNQVRMVIAPTGEWEFTVVQADKRLTIEVSSVRDDQHKLAQAPGFHGEKMSMNFQNIDVRAALNVIADYTKLNIIASDAVQGTVTLRLKDVPWDQVLDTILRAKGLDMRKQDSVIWVAPREEISKREKDALESEQEISEVEPMHTEYFHLSYAKADEVAAVLTNDKQKILSKRGSVNVDKRTNQVIVHDILSGIEEARHVIGKVDIYMRQVQIEARIVEASDSFGRSLGARLGVNNVQATGVMGGRLGLGGGLGTTAGLSGQVAQLAGAGAGSTYTPDGLSVNLPATPSASGAAAGALSMVLFNNAATRFLNLELSALEADGRGKIVSSPRVVTADQEAALIEQGTELPYQQASASGATTVAFRKANLSLKVEPHITPDGNIIMSVEINKDAPGAITAGGIAINTKHVKTTVMIENGGTVVIGGIYTQDERTDTNKIPVLGDIPVAGALFRNKTRSDSKTELLIFLTPMILDGRPGNNG